MRPYAPLAAGIAILSLQLCAGSAAAEMYKWRDKNGNLHITDYPPQGGAKPMDLESIRINRLDFPSTREPEAQPAPAREAPTPAPAPESAPRAREYPRVEVYGTSWCPACRHARDYFRSAGIPFDDYDVEKDRNALARMNRLGGGSGVPAIVIGGQVMRGFSRKWCERALGIR